ncbi:MAG: hypothetical protein KA436_05420 [Oligoflexales bacterium]|nr:hypothetical protein [Oligoflexales bacterium]
MGPKSMYISPRRKKYILGLAASIFLLSACSKSPTPKAARVLPHNEKTSSEQFLLDEIIGNTDFKLQALPAKAFDINTSELSLQTESRGQETKVVRVTFDYKNAATGFLAWKNCPVDQPTQCSPWRTEYRSFFDILASASVNTQYTFKQCFEDINSIREEDRKLFSNCDPSSKNPDKWCCGKEKTILHRMDEAPKINGESKAAEQACVKKDQEKVGAYLGHAKQIIKLSQDFIDKKGVDNLQKAKEQGSMTHIVWNISSYDPYGLAQILETGTVGLDLVWANMIQQGLSKNSDKKPPTESYTTTKMLSAAGLALGISAIVGGAIWLGVSISRIRSENASLRQHAMQISRLNDAYDHILSSSEDELPELKKSLNERIAKIKDIIPAAQASQSRLLQEPRLAEPTPRTPVGDSLSQWRVTQDLDTDVIDEDILKAIKRLDSALKASNTEETEVTPVKRSATPQLSDFKNTKSNALEKAKTVLDNIEAQYKDKSASPGKGARKTGPIMTVLGAFAMILSGTLFTSLGAAYALGENKTNNLESSFLIDLEKIWDQVKKTKMEQERDREACLYIFAAPTPS